MERKNFDELLSWKNSKYRKPLIIEGARQVGKTWLMQEFGSRYYDNVAYFDFFRDENVGGFFETTKDPKRLIELLSIYIGEAIVPEKTLVIFDEIQESPDALNSLKYFYQDSPDYHVICAGSLLGVTLANSKGAPVGKVDFMTLSPLLFDEFLAAIDEERLVKFLNLQQDLTPVPEAFHQLLIEKLKQFYLIGGMPEAVLRWIETKDISEVRRVHEAILHSYRLDFAKHTTEAEQNRLTLVWQSIPSQLIKENKRFIYSLVRKGARARDFEASLQWVINAGLIQKINWNSATGIPVAAYDDPNVFKTYLLDVGLLTTLAGVDTAIIAQEQSLFTDFNGGLAENYVCNHLYLMFGNVPRYWTDGNAKQEIDFLIQHDNVLYPIEVKAGTVVKSKSLQAFSEKYHSRLRMRYSLKNLSLDGNLLNIPLYMVEESKMLIDAALKTLEH